MAQFLHLSLLLATIQLPLVSVIRIHLREGTTVTFKFKQGCKVTKCCRDQQCVDSCVPNHCKFQVNQDGLTIESLGPDDGGNYTCYFDSGKCNLNLNLIVTTGCINDCLEDFEFSPQPQKPEKSRKNADECRKLCTKSSTCKYFTFHTKNEKCFLITSKDLVIEENKHFVSGCCGCPEGQTDDAVDLQFHPEAKSWFDAFKHCKEMNWSLVQITTSVQREVNSLLQNHSSSINDGVWIGLERSMFGKDQIPWKWISGLEVRQPQWNSSFPVDRLNNHCGKIIQVNETDVKWLDAWCHDKLPFICQNSTGRHS